MSVFVPEPGDIGIMDKRYGGFGSAVVLGVVHGEPRDARPSFS